MKAIMKTISDEFNLNYDLTFSSTENLEIRRRLIPELKKSLLPQFKLSVVQLNTWLSSLHKSQHVTKKMHSSGTFEKNEHRLYLNSRTNNVIFVIFVIFDNFYFILLIVY